MGKDPTFFGVSRKSIDLQNVRLITFNGNEIELLHKNNSREVLKFPTHDAMMQALKSWADHSMQTESEKQLADALNACRAELKQGERAQTPPGSLT